MIIIYIYIDIYKCKKQNVTSVFVAGARAFARNAAVAESIYEKTQDLGIHINPVDLPDLKDHNPNPAQKMRPVIFAYTELEKNITVQRLQHGWNQRLQTERKTDVQGSRCAPVSKERSKEHLQKNLSYSQRKQLKAKCLSSKTVVQHSQDKAGRFFSLFMSCSIQQF